MLATWVIDLRGIDIGDKAADHREIAAGVLLCRAAQSLIARNIIAGLVNRCVQVLAALPRVEPSAHLLPFAGKESCAFDFAGGSLGQKRINRDQVVPAVQVETLEECERDFCIRFDRERGIHASPLSWKAKSSGLQAFRKAAHTWTNCHGIRRFSTAESHSCLERKGTI